MGFSNEYLTEEEKELIAKTEHKLLTRKKGDHYECVCRIVTVDREKKIWMIRVVDGYSYERDEERFIGFYEEICTDKIIDFRVRNLGAETDAEIVKHLGVEDINNWEITELKLSKDLQNHRMKIENVLEEIMTAYAMSGHPRENEFKGQFKAILKESKTK